MGSQFQFSFGSLRKPTTQFLFQTQFQNSDLILVKILLCSSWGFVCDFSRSKNSPIFDRVFDSGSKNETQFWSKLVPFFYVSRRRVNKLECFWLQFNPISVSVLIQVLKIRPGSGPISGNLDQQQWLTSG
jgi:hypothetical protein